MTQGFNKQETTQAQIEQIDEAHKTLINFLPEKSGPQHDKHTFSQTALPLTKRHGGHAVKSP